MTKTSSSAWAIPASIVLGCCAIGTAIFLGLTMRPAPEVVRAPVASEAATQAEASSQPKPAVGVPIPTSPSGLATGNSGAAALALATMGGPSEAPPERSPVPPALPGQLLSPAQIQAEVRQRLEAMRPVLVAKCWKPVAGQNGVPQRVELTLDGTVGTTGGFTAVGVSDSRSAHWPGVATCITEQLAGMALPSAAGPVHIRIQFSIP